MRIRYKIEWSLFNLILYWNETKSGYVSEKKLFEYLKKKRNKKNKINLYQKKAILSTKRESSYLLMLSVFHFNSGRGYFNTIILLQRELWHLKCCGTSHMAGLVSETIIFPIDSDTDGKMAVWGAQQGIGVYTRYLF